MLPYPPLLAVVPKKDVEPKDEQNQQHVEVNEPLELLQLYLNHLKIVTIVGTKVLPMDRDALKQMLVEHRDVFIWSHEEMPSVDNVVINHYLGIDPAHKLIRQKKRAFSVEKYTTINQEVEKLLAVGFIKKAHYPEWL